MKERLTYIIKVLVGYYARLYFNKKTKLAVLRFVYKQAKSYSPGSSKYLLCLGYRHYSLIEEGMFYWDRRELKQMLWEAYIFSYNKIARKRFKALQHRVCKVKGVDALYGQWWLPLDTNRIQFIKYLIGKQL